MIFTEEIENTLQQAVIFALEEKDGEKQSSLDELCRLLDTAGAVCVKRFLQHASPEAKTYIGSGKAAEIAEFCKYNEIALAVCDDELSPSQIKNLEDIMDGVEVIDRSMLILEIFKRHAVSAEGKLQVEIAELRYTIPRLIGKGAQLSRQGGGGGGARRGSGESKLETDRRHVEHRIEYLKSQLEQMERTRTLQRHSRERSGITRVAVAGYTNAGKSTLLNLLTNAGILAEDKLFATLDTTTRKYTLPSGTEILLTDTVGFIQRLPHHLIKAFRSTLEEVAYADVIVIVCDVSDKNCANELDVCEKLLSELGAGGKPTVYVFNKCDAISSLPYELSASKYASGVMMSALTGEGKDAFTEALEAAISSNSRRFELLIPHRDGAALSKLYAIGNVESTEYTDGGTKVFVTLKAKDCAQFEKYSVKE